MGLGALIKAVAGFFGPQMCRILGFFVMFCGPIPTPISGRFILSRHFLGQELLSTVEARR